MKKPMQNYQVNFARNKAAKEARAKKEAAKIESVVVSAKVEEQVVETIVETVPEQEVETMEPTAVMDNRLDPVEEDEDEEIDLEAYSLKFVKQEEEVKPQTKEDTLEMVISTKKAADTILRWCAGQQRALLVLGANDLAIMVILGSYNTRLAPAKIDKIAAALISGNMKLFVSQPNLNRLVKMGLVSRQQIEGTRGFSYALTEAGIKLTQVLPQLHRPDDSEGGEQE